LLHPPIFFRELNAFLFQLQTELQDLERFGQGAENTWRTFDLMPALESAWRMVSDRLPLTVPRTLEIAALPPVWGCPAELEQALLYLLDFAAELIDPQGELLLWARPAADGGVEIALRFTGPEFFPGECEALLNPFQDSAGIQGSLGPALAAAITAQHGGSLKVEPQERGLFFLLTLPKGSVAQNGAEAGI
jgi:signal transduction histidine kinase